MLNLIPPYREGENATQSQICQRLRRAFPGWRRCNEGEREATGNEGEESIERGATGNEGEESIERVATGFGPAPAMMSIRASCFALRAKK